MFAVKGCDIATVRRYCETYALQRRSVVGPQIRVITSEMFRPGVFNRESGQDSAFCIRKPVRGGAVKCVHGCLCTNLKTPSSCILQPQERRSIQSHERLELRPSGGECCCECQVCTDLV